MGALDELLADGVLDELPALGVLVLVFADAAVEFVLWLASTPVAVAPTAAIAANPAVAMAIFRRPLSLTVTSASCSIVAEAAEALLDGRALSIGTGAM